MPYRVRRCVSGRVIEEDKYYSYKCPCAGEKRQRRTESLGSSERQKKANARAAEDRVRWLMNGNFKNGDRSMVLSYRKGEEPTDIGQLKADAQKYVRQLKRLYEKQGEVLKYIYALGAGPHRRHVHILVNKVQGVDISLVEQTWGKGRVQDSPVYTENQMGELARYYIKNATETREQQEEMGEKPGRYYYGSHSLEQPKITKITVNKSEYRKTVYMKSWERKGYYLDKEASDKQKYTDAFGYEHYGYTLIRGTDDTSIHNNGQEKPKAIRRRACHLQNQRRTGKAVPHTGP